MLVQSFVSTAHVFDSLPSTGFVRDTQRCGKELYEARGDVLDHRSLVGSILRKLKLDRGSACVVLSSRGIPSRESERMVDGCLRSIK